MLFKRGKKIQGSISKRNKFIYKKILLHTYSVVEEAFSHGQFFQGFCFVFLKQENKDLP